MNELKIEEGIKTGTGSGSGAGSGTKSGTGAGTKSGAGTGAKRGPKPKNQSREFVIDEEQRKFFVDLSHEDDERRLIFELLKKANTKDYGREIIFKDLAVFALAKLTDKDLLKIQEGSLSKQEKLQKVVDEYNQKNNTTLSFEDYFLMKAGIN